jgi:hypothetical protein
VASGGVINPLTSKRKAHEKSILVGFGRFTCCQGPTFCLLRPATVVITLRVMNLITRSVMTTMPAALLGPARCGGDRRIRAW